MSAWAINSLFQIVAFALLGYFYLKVLPGWLGLNTVGLHLSIAKIAETVAIFLGVPLVAGFATRTIGERARGREWYETVLLARIALPLLAYFAIMWFGSFALGRSIGLGYERTAALAFTAAGNNFELAIAVAIGVFAVTSGQALAGVVGPLIEVPVLVALVYVSLRARRHFVPKPRPDANEAR